MMCYVHTCMFVLELRRNAPPGARHRVVGPNGKLIPFVLPCSSVNGSSTEAEQAFDVMLWNWFARN